MKIGCDIDGCIFDTVGVLVEEANKYLGANLTKEDFTEYHTEKKIGIPTKDFSKIIADVISRDTLPEICGASLVLNWLSEMHDIWFITKRQSSIFHETINQLDNIGIEAKDRLIMVDSHLMKSLWVKDLGLDVLIEDNPYVVTDVYTSTNAKILMFDYAYNRYIAENSRIWVVRYWTEVRDILRRI